MDVSSTTAVQLAGLKKPRFLGLKNFLKTPKAEFMFIGFYILCNLINKPHIKIFNFDL